MALSKAFHPFAVIHDLKRTIASIREQWRSTRRENERLREENEQWRERAQRLEREREQLREENERLKRQLEEAQRTAKRQAAPFARGVRKRHPQRPGRKPGAAYGKRHSKPIPDQVDEVIAVPAPARCACGGALDVEKIEAQYQHEIVRKTVWKRFDVTICRCTVCHQRVHGRDPRQTSDAFGAAAVQVGPDALALAVTMNKRLGMPHADVATVLQDGFGLHVNRSTVCRAVARVARRGEATWHALRDAARRSLVNAIDETGWNVAAQLRWLWVVVSEQVTFCDILPGRSFTQAASLLGTEYDGWLTHDGWAVYYKFLKAGHQSCLAHLIRRCRDLAAVATPAAARFPRRVKALLEEGLALRDRYANKEISLHGLWTATGRLEVKLDRVLGRTYRDAANRRLVKHLWHERPYLFTFLYCPGLDATNNAAERAIRALVGARKNWGGNRTPNGARAQAVLTSLLQTARQQGKNPFDVVVELLCSRERRKILDLVPLNREPLQDSSPAPPPAVTAADTFPVSSLGDLAVPA
jgi:transposase